MAYRSKNIYYTSKKFLFRSCDQQTETQRSLDIEKVWGLFALLGFGLLCAFIIALFEKFFFLIHKDRSNHKSQKIIFLGSS